MWLLRRTIKKIALAAPGRAAGVYKTAATRVYKAAETTGMSTGSAAGGKRCHSN